MIPWKGVFLHIILPEEPALHWGPGQSLVSLDHLWKETPAGTEQWPLTSLSSCLLTLALLPGFITQASPGFCIWIFGSVLLFLAILLISQNVNL